MKAIASFALAFLFLLTSNVAHAVFGTPYVTPDHPVAGQTISMNIYQGGCDGIAGIPGYPQITQTGTAVRAVFNGERYTDPELCTFGFGIATYAISAYPAGSYTLQIDLRYANGGGDFVIETLGVVPFTVSGSVLAPVAAPASTMGGLAILTILMVLAALLAFRARRSDVFFILLVVVPLCTCAQSTPPDCPHPRIAERLSASGAPLLLSRVRAYEALNSA